MSWTPDTSAGPSASNALDRTQAPTVDDQTPPTRRGLFRAGGPAVRLVLLLVVLGGFALRVYRLDAHDIWGDEAVSIYRSSMSLLELLATKIETHPPGYPALLFVWLRVAGIEPFATRLLSVLLGVVGVALTYALGRAVGSRGVGLLGATLMAGSPFAVYYSQETRMYMLALVLTLSASLALCRWVRHASSAARRDASDRSLTIWAIVTAAGLSTHYYTAFVLAAHHLAVAVARRRAAVPLRPWVVAQLPVAVVAASLALSQAAFLSGQARWSELSDGVAEALTVWVQSVEALGVGTTPARAWPWGALGPPLVALCGIGVALRGARPRHGRDPHAIVLAALLPFTLVVPLALAAVASLAMPLFHPRYLLICLPSFLLLVALAVVAVARPSPTAPMGAIRTLRLMAAAGLLAVGTVPGVLSLHAYYTDPTYAKGGYGRLMTVIRREAQPGDALLLANRLQGAIYTYYTWLRPHGLPVYWFPPSHPWSDPRTQAELRTLASKHPRLWLVMFGNPAEYDPNRELERWLARHGFRTFRGEFVDATLSLYLMSPPGAGEVRPLNLRLGERILLLDYQLSGDVVRPGEVLSLTLRWQALAPVERRYTVFTHLLGSTVNPTLGNRIWAQNDSEPAGGTRPTHQWRPGEVVDDRYGLRLDPNTPPGTYELEVGMYHLPTGERLSVRSPDDRAIGDRVVLQTVTVAP